MPKVSVIIPVFNTEKYLRKCLNSVCNQTLQDIEIICINDCSTDGSLEILREYAGKDIRIKLIELFENGGAAKARNIGIDIAEGEYLGFVDSDDFVDLDFYEKLYQKAVETDADVVKGAYKYFDTVYVNTDLNKKVLENGMHFAFEFCSAIFKKTMLLENNVLFPLLCDMEDPVFAYKAAVCAKNKIVTVEDCYINIIKRFDSQTASIPRGKQILDKIEGFKQLVNISKEFQVPEKVSGYVLALWIKVIMDACTKSAFFERLSLIQGMISLYIKIENKDLVQYYLNKMSPFIARALATQDIAGLFVYDKEEIIKQKSDIISSKNIEINEKKITINSIERYVNQMVDEYCKEKLLHTDCEDVYFISVVNNYDLYNKCLKNNSFVKYPSNYHLVVYDNTKENVFISKRYNSFINSYNYRNEAWFVFCHCDWQPMEDMNAKLKYLDKGAVYGTIGSIANFINGKVYTELVGMCYERRRDGSDFRILGNYAKTLELADTFDCQVIIIHSSLIQKYNLRFDENLKWDLYVEDFCINAKTKYGIKSYIIPFYACHWSGYHITPPSYYESLTYINKKYPDKIASGTVSLIGGKNLPLASEKDILFYKLRNGKFLYNVRTNIG